jgi:hypothetical protein
MGLPLEFFLGMNDCGTCCFFFIWIGCFCFVGTRTRLRIRIIGVKIAFSALGFLDRTWLTPRCITNSWFPPFAKITRNNSFFKTICIFRSLFKPFFPLCLFLVRLYFRWFAAVSCHLLLFELTTFLKKLFLHYCQYNKLAIMLGPKWPHLKRLRFVSSWQVTDIHWTKLF